MTLEELLQDKRKAIQERWLNLVLADYSPDTSKFLKSKRNQFDNPVGHTLVQGLDVLCNALIDGTDDESIEATLEDVIRIRAVQEMPPSVGVGFLFHLKRAVDKEVGKRAKASELRAFEKRVDLLALRAFDLYMTCRTKLFEIRIDDLRRNHLDIRDQVALRKERRAKKAGAADDKKENVPSEDSDQ